MEKLCLPLEGVKVLELATVVAAPGASRILADYGAEVIKIESPPYGDLSRITGREHMLPIEDGNNPFFDHLNAGKKLLAVNLKTAEGMEIFMKLLGEADIFITNVRGQSLKKLGIDYDSVKDRFPQLIYGHFTGLGTEGEEANRAVYDQTGFWSRTGAIKDTLAGGSAPANMPFAFGDLASSNMLIEAILMAYIGRAKHGKGAYASASLLKSAIWCNSTSVLNAQPQYGKAYPEPRYEICNPFSTYYCCGDGEWIGMFDRAYERNREYFAEIFALPVLLEDEDFFTLDAMMKSGKIPSLVHALEESFKTKSSEEWRTLLGNRDVICEIVKHFKDIYADPQAAANGWFEEVEYEAGTTCMPTPPVDFVGYDRKPLVKAGSLGCDNDEVLSSLGYSAEEIAEIREKKVII